MRRISGTARAVSGLVLAAALSAPAASAAAPVLSGEVFIKLPAGSRAGDHAGQIEIQSWSWGDSSAAHRAGGSNQLSMDDTAGKEKSTSSFGDWIADVERPQASGAPYRANDRLRNAGPKNGNSAAGDPDRPIIAGSVPNASPRVTGANETITVGGGRTETDQATGKRQHLPIRARAYYDQPQGKGSVWIRVATPWSACRAGARYPSLELAAGARNYLLQDVTVASCGASAAEEIAFYYNKVTVRGWDPKKKEE